MKIEYHHDHPEGGQFLADTSAPTISGARLRAVRDHLGMSDAQAATVLGISRRTLIRWEASDEIPAAGARRLAYLVRLTEEVVEHLSARGGQVAIRRDGWRDIGGHTVLPESWWRTVVGRVPALHVVWGEH